MRFLVVVVGISVADFRDEHIRAVMLASPKA
jgi:hypothetical protein